MADNKEEKTTEVQEQKLDNGYSQPVDSRADPEVKPNLKGADFSHLEGTDAANPGKPLDSTPAGAALGHDGGHTMTQNEEPLQTENDAKKK